MNNAMTSFERVLNTLKGKPKDRVPVVPETFGVTAKTCGYSIYEYVTDASKLAESQLKARSLAGHDILFSFADLSVESEATGCKLSYKEDQYPAVAGPVAVNAGDIKNRDLPDPWKDGRMPVVLEASSRLRDAVKDTCIVAGCMMGPLSLAGQMMGLEHLLYQMADDPGAVDEVLDFTEEVARRYGMALLKAGVHCHVIFDPVASPIVVPHEMFRKLELPRLRRLFSEFRRAGSLISWLSIAGNTRKILPFYREANVELATVDYTVPVSEAFDLLGTVAVNGNMMPFCFVSCSPEEIKEAALKCLEETVERGNFLLGSGCEVPVEADISSVKALVEASQEFAVVGNNR